MTVGLVADIPYEFVIWGVENVMQRDGKFYHSKAGSQMPLFGGNYIDDKVA